MTYTFRAPTMNDLQGVHAAFEADALHTVGFPLLDIHEIEHEWWGDPAFDLSQDARVAVASDGQIVAYMSVMPRSPYVRMFCPMIIHPQHRAPEIEDTLFAWVEARGRELMHQAPPDTRVVLIDSTMATDPYYLELYARKGYQVVRHSQEMLIKLTEQPPAPVFPEGITVRAFVPEKDMRRTFLANREAFSDHFGYVPVPLEEAYERFVHRTKADDFDPALWFIAEEGDEVVATALCRPSMPEDPNMAWVDTLGVRRNWRRQGIALAMLHHVFTEMYKRGKTSVALGVDSQSLTGATRLYEKAGMHLYLRFDMVEKVLREGVDITTVAVAE